VRGALADARVAPHQLTLEITEGLLVEDGDKIQLQLRELKDIGVRLAVDDFGTGYSALSYLRSFPLDVLKIDRSFVAGMRNNADDRIIVESTAQMAHAMRLELVAEGVETEWDAKFLQNAGYDYVQGFRYAGAMPPERCLAWLLEFNATAMINHGDTTLTTALTAHAARQEDDALQAQHHARQG
jgi:EAL domain-containing protein (putative c-di-GMP-specific phosphodiesterase class I)